jgi:hypothetical protein
LMGFNGSWWELIKRLIRKHRVEGILPVLYFG